MFSGTNLTTRARRSQERFDQHAHVVERLTSCMRFQGLGRRADNRTIVQSEAHLEFRIGHTRWMLLDRTAYYLARVTRGENREWD